MPNWKMEGTSVVWDENAPDPVAEEDEERIAGIDLGSTYPAADEGEFDPADHNIEDVKSYVNEHPDEAQRILDAEVDGKNRTTLVDWLTAE